MRADKWLPGSVLDSGLDPVPGAESSGLLVSPGPDSAQLAMPAMPSALPTAPAFSFAPQLVTPAPVPLPAPGENWLDRALREAKAAVSNGLGAFADGEDAGRVVRQISVPGLLGQAQEAVGNVAKAAQLRDLLPLAIIAIGVAVGKPAAGILAGAALWIVQQEQAQPAPRP